MDRKPSYEELEERIKYLESELASKKKDTGISDDFKRLADSLEDVMYHHDISSKTFTFYNKFGQKLYGLKGKDGKPHTSKGVFLSIHKEDREKVKKAAKDSLKPGCDKGKVEYRQYHPDGSLRWMHDRWTVIRDKSGTPVAIEGVVRDNTEHNQALESLKRAEAKYRNVARATSDIIYEFQIKDEIFTYISPNCEEILGYTAHEVINKKHFIRKKLILPEDFEKIKKKIVTVFKGSENKMSIEFKMRCKDGSIKYMFENAILIRDKNGRVVRATGSYKDITDMKRMEAQLHQAQKIEAIGTLAGGIAHDFNNLLMGIQGRTSLMMMDTDSSHPIFEHLKGIEDYVESGAELTRQLLGFARGGKYEIKPTDLNELVKSQNRMFGRTRKEITLRGKYEKNLWTAEVDKGQIDQVLLNLYVNAWQAMPAGGDLYVQTANVILDETYGRPFIVKPGKYVMISVADTGTGMDETTRERIFDPFFTTKEMGRGTGLGLASVYGIIKNHGGFIDVDSEKGEGATFKIYLPATSAKSKEPGTKRKKQDEPAGGKETVLLVDDEEMIIDVAGQMIEKLGYNVLVARSGKEAIEIVSKAQEARHMEKESKAHEVPAAMPPVPDIIILDMIMPHMSGGETYDGFKDITPKVKVLLSSGYSIDGKANEIMERGCNGFIQKPFNMKSLSLKIREILNEK